ncbi:MAG: hypothetical protein VX871_06545 [Pseudomonadota bacterium]|nr:hypothetical protein [Pseudomonadota bacterium]
MEQAGFFLYVIFALLLWYFWRQVRGATLDDLLRRSESEHHHVAAVLKKHPEGGSWGQFSAWMRRKH